MTSAPDNQDAPVQPMFGAGLVSNAPSGGAMLEEGFGPILVAVLLGAFLGLILGLMTLHLARFFSVAIGRNFGSAAWTLISMALGAMAFGIISAANKD